MITYRYHLFTEFICTFFHYAMHIREVVLSLILLIVAGGCVLAKLEDLRLIDAIYFAFITALSVGYGDIHPTTTTGKVLCVGIALVGMLFVGLTVAIGNRALADTAKGRLNSRP